ncbi:glycosyltransferase family 2 protein [Planctomycetota bacterium]
MDYDVVIATRNRTEALKLSIPLILTQERPPKKLIIVDASDDHQLICKTVKEAVGACPVELAILNSQPNSAGQRNIGLKYVESPIVMFPDDDSLWFPGHAEAIMRVYERDTEKHIGGVCAADTKQLPPEIGLVGCNIYKMRISHLLDAQIKRTRAKLREARFRPNPFKIHGRSRWNVRPVPKWLPHENSVLVEYMGGYKMTFRTEVIRKVGFDEDLGVYVPWAANEDIDACFGVMQHRLLVGARNAKVCHYKFPSRRTTKFESTFIVQFNAAYTLCKYCTEGSKARRVFNRRSIGKVLKYIPRCCIASGREQLRGHLLAVKFMRELWNAPPDCLRQRYLELCQTAFRS